MRLKHFYLPVFLFLGLAAGSAKAANDASESSSSLLHGTWSSGTGALITFASPGVYSLDVEPDGRTDVHGTYLVEGDIVVFKDTLSSSGLGCSGEHGAYRFDLQATRLSLTPLKDGCAGRSGRLAAIWTKRG